MCVLCVRCTHAGPGGPYQESDAVEASEMHIRRRPVTEGPGDVTGRKRVGGEDADCLRLGRQGGMSVLQGLRSRAWRLLYSRSDSVCTR